MARLKMREIIEVQSKEIEDFIITHKELNLEIDHLNKACTTAIDSAADKCKQIDSLKSILTRLEEAVRSRLAVTGMPEEKRWPQQHNNQCRAVTEMMGGEFIEPPELSEEQRLLEYMRNIIDDMYRTVVEPENQRGIHRRNY